MSAIVKMFSIHGKEFPYDPNRPSDIIDVIYNMQEEETDYWLFRYKLIERLREVFHTNALPNNDEEIVGLLVKMGFVKIYDVPLTFDLFRVGRPTYPKRTVYRADN